MKHWLCGGNFLTRPPTGKPKHAISPGEGLLFPSLHHHTFSPKGVAGMAFTARIGRAQFHRARSASKKDGLATPSPSKLARFSLQGEVRIYPLLRASTEHILIVRGLRAGGIDQTSPHVSIISNRASNSCPQAVQRMQSDSPVNSSVLIPMPPQSGQRASWTL